MNTPCFLNASCTLLNKAVFFHNCVKWSDSSLSLGLSMGALS